MSNGAAVVVLKEKLATPLKEFIGTGPYQLKARVPDQYIQLARYDGYQPLDAEPDGYGGAPKHYLDEIRFAPFSTANTRVEGAAAGQYDYVDALSVESIGKLKNRRADP